MARPVDKDGLPHRGLEPPGGSGAVELAAVLVSAQDVVTAWLAKQTIVSIIVHAGSRQRTTAVRLGTLTARPEGMRVHSGSIPGRRRMLTTALWLVTVSVAFGIASGTLSVITGLHGHSLGVLAVGLDVLADVAGVSRLDLAVPR